MEQAAGAVQIVGAVAQAIAGMDLGDGRLGDEAQGLEQAVIGLGTLGQLDQVVSDTREILNELMDGDPNYDPTGHSQGSILVASQPIEETLQVITDKAHDILAIVEAELDALNAAQKALDISRTKTFQEGDALTSRSMDEDLLACKELQDMHKKYRNLYDRERTFHQNSEAIMRLQNALLCNLRGDNRVVQQKLDEYWHVDYAPEIARLQEQANKFTKMIEVESKKLNDLESTIEQFAAKELAAMTAMGGRYAARDMAYHTCIMIKILENRVEKANYDLNMVNSHNKALKQEMKKLHFEQGIYDSIQAKMERDMESNKKETNKYLEWCNAMYEERHEIQRIISEILEMEECERAYYRWQNTGGWSHADASPLQETIRRKDPEDEAALASQYETPTTIRFRLLIEYKAFHKTQHLLRVRSIKGVLPALLQARERNAQLYANLLQLSQAIAEEEAELEAMARARAGLVGTPGEQEMMDLLNLIASCGLSDEELLPIIKELQKGITITFQEAGLDYEEEELDLYHPEVEEQAFVQSLEMAIAKLFSCIESFIDRLSGILG